MHIIIDFRKRFVCAEKNDDGVRIKHHQIDIQFVRIDLSELINFESREHQKNIPNSIQL